MTAPDRFGVWGPVIDRDDDSAEFFDAAARDQLLFRRCSECSRALPMEASVCSACGGTELAWHPAAGTGVLISWAVVHSPPHPAFADEVPFVTGIVELTEGPWMHARILGERLTSLAPLTVEFVHPGDGESYPVFAHAE